MSTTVEDFTPGRMMTRQEFYASYVPKERLQRSFKRLGGSDYLKRNNIVPVTKTEIVIAAKGDDAIKFVIEIRCEDQQEKKETRQL